MLHLPSRSQSDFGDLTEAETSRKRLHLSHVPQSFPCREDEIARIYSTLDKAINEGHGCCLYISGVPGTGKTATVHEVIRLLSEQAESGSLNPFNYVEINALKLSDPTHAYIELWKAINENRKRDRFTAKTAQVMLNEYFSTPSPRRVPWVVLIDELDLLATKKQQVLYNFFEWPSLKHAKLIVVAIANTMDLPERLMLNKISSRVGLIRMNFKPYNHQQLCQIVASRLEGLNLFKSDAIEFCARKVSSISGDARRALDICRRAVEILEVTRKDKTPDAQVTIQVIDQVCRDIIQSPSIQAIQRGSTHQKVFLLAVFRQIRKTGKSEVKLLDVLEEHGDLCQLRLLDRPSKVELCQICSQLAASKLVFVEPSFPVIHRTMRLNVSEQDLDTAFMKDEHLKKLL
ncbi:P-loop containing nucleoside triphosphate hydrolase protein [Cladochytrium replicatum]|nr:P-loop containing nucleoside triphosphate hydrolase protein [Cladochytrium replicatum]